MMKLFSTAIFLVILIFTACNETVKENTNGEDALYISGKLENGSGQSVEILRMLPGKYITLDSVLLNTDVSFELSVPVEEKGFYAIGNNEGDYINFVAGKGDNIHIVSDYNDFDEYEITGTEEAEQITLLHRATQKFLDEVEAYAQIVRDSIASPRYRELRLEIDRNYRIAFNRLKNFSRDFIERNQGSLVALMALTNQVGKNQYVFDPVDDFDIYLMVDTVLMNKYPESEAVKNIHTRVELIRLNNSMETKKPEPGNPAPDFRIRNTKDEYFSLSDIRNKYVFLNFWASWCAPCRDEHPALTEIYNKFNKYNFEIIQISLDAEYGDWIQAIKNDSLSWKHGSELNFWDSGVAKKYGVNSIPSNFLIDKDGTTIAKNLSPTELKNMLTKLLTEPES